MYFLEYILNIKYRFKLIIYLRWKYNIIKLFNFNFKILIIFIKKIFYYFNMITNTIRKYLLNKSFNVV